MKKSIIIFVILLYSIPSFAWTIRTPAGIRIVTGQRTIKQYSKHWSFPVIPEGCPVDMNKSWQDVDWAKVDNFFYLMRAKHHAGDSDPRNLVINIMPVNYDCKDEDANSYEFLSDTKWGCIDGRFIEPNVIQIHLGDDPGQGDKAFCKTALDHELDHYFLRIVGNHCWEYEFNPDCFKFYFGAQDSDLCQ